jgi:hypothetical protein
MLTGCAAHPTEIPPGYALTTDGDAWRHGKTGATAPDPFAGARDIDLRKIPTPEFK